MTLARLLDTIKPGLPPWGPHVRFRRVQTLVREGSPLVKLRNSALELVRDAAKGPARDLGELGNDLPRASVEILPNCL